MRKRNELIILWASIVVVFTIMIFGATAQCPTGTFECQKSFLGIIPLPEGLFLPILVGIIGTFIISKGRQNF